MNEQLRELVRERLSAAADCPAKEDIIEEITADLTEKYNELVSGGAQPEEAMEQVQAGIGDLDEVAAYINEVARRSAENQKAGNNNPFAGLDETMKQMARDDHVVLSALQPETVANRAAGQEGKTTAEEEQSHGE